MAHLTHISAPGLATANGLSNVNSASDISLADSQVRNGDFSSLLKQSLAELNASQEDSDRALADMANGTVKDLHQAAITIGKAETSMKLMLEVRNKAISAYKEILRTQI
ncbi:flagellar hook-basal body complex protein FliE [Helicobacter saguini]|uniref:Flagellar hook-basal body complex protein FliE n=1 Tax=Helicobacter saguini TaxID=1548018 RepID=A0A347VQT2_9HELI|nr:flagellar hook-basal body complex protein FliE [Helicobacter saguini]MWV63168.1 flagellar hook-basal body complex protein FliE [Helicobacter saguini]MWV66162.1 flagellar hook-basal body complex protein FliE [Helicobacter saguini]MWV68511.1 flagellar hook-basal body complex protein FliE [Helicobacter saguini]MWV71934.1 flagellar hook-basal body complex protein FliE [Helicobacter saguini]TLD95946.1 flagellar hook-basal body complex protein FliE [Helicobacter saguini]